MLSFQTAQPRHEAVRHVPCLFHPALIVSIIHLSHWLITCQDSRTASPLWLEHSRGSVVNTEWTEWMNKHAEETVQVHCKVSCQMSIFHSICHCVQPEGLSDYCLSPTGLWKSHDNRILLTVMSPPLSMELRLATNDDHWMNPCDDKST